MIQYTDTVIYPLSPMTIRIMMMSSQRQWQSYKSDKRGLTLGLEATLSTTLLGDTSNYKNTITKGLNELEEFLKVYNINSSLSFKRQ